VAVAVAGTPLGLVPEATDFLVVQVVVVARHQRASMVQAAQAGKATTAETISRAGVIRFGLAAAGAVPTQWEQTQPQLLEVTVGLARQTLIQDRQ
jgi:hypothetical protein